MSCSVGEHYTQQEADRDGIVMGHAYTLLSVAQVLDAHGQAINLVKLRNPWGSGEWNGAWSDKSPLWTDDIRGQVDFFSDKDDGIFWMDYNDFKSIFGFASCNDCVDRIRQSVDKFGSRYDCMCPLCIIVQLGQMTVGQTYGRACIVRYREYFLA